MSRLPLLESFNGIFWLLLALGPLLLLQRSLHREIQAFFFILTRRADLAIAFFSILFFPGVLLHEGSHYLTARLLRVRTGKFSILPRSTPDGRLQLGYVETARADWLRDTLIGAAPLVVGGLLVGYIGVYRLELLELWKQVLTGEFTAISAGVSAFFHQPDVWLWFYLAFTISSTMLPSASDRSAWLPMALILALLLGISLLAGAGPWLAQHLAGPLNRFLLASATVFFISDFFHAFLLLPAFALRKGLSLLTGIEVK